MTACSGLWPAGRRTLQRQRIRLLYLATTLPLWSPVAVLCCRPLALPSPWERHPCHRPRRCQRKTFVGTAAPSAPPTPSFVKSVAVCYHGYDHRCAQ